MLRAILLFICQSQGLSIINILFIFCEQLNRQYHPITPRSGSLSRRVREACLSFDARRALGGGGFAASIWKNNSGCSAPSGGAMRMGGMYANIEGATLRCQLVMECHRKESEV